MEEWKEYKLGEVCTELSDGLHKAPKFKFGGDYIFVNAKNIVNGFIVDNDPTKKSSYEEFLKYASPLNDTTILYSIDGTIGNVALYRGEKCILGKGACYLNPNPNVLDRLFLYYELQSPRFKGYIDRMSTGSTIKHISLKTMRNYSFTFPSIKRQRQISSILKSIDDKIEVNRRINDNLEQQAQALFKSWFVDFEPFRDQPFVESELGMIPEGWRIYSMDELVDVIGGYSYKGEELKESQTAMATIKNFERDGGFKTTGFKEIIPSPKVKPEQFLGKFDIIIAHTDLTQNADIIGNPALLLSFGNYKKLIMSMDLVKTKPKNDAISFGLLYSIFADTRFKSHALGYVNGTTVLHLSKKAIPEYRISLPGNLNELALYGSIFDSIFRKESEMMDESRRLAELRDTLLPRLMSGEIKVGDVTL